MVSALRGRVRWEEDTYVEAERGATRGVTVGRPFEALAAMTTQAEAKMAYKRNALSVLMVQEGRGY